MRILIIEDDLEISAFVAKGLRQEGYAVETAHPGDDGLALALATPYDAAVVDIMLPGKDGLEVIETLREKRVNTPVLILSARHSVDDRVRGIQRGGDDYMVKPFAFSELLVRIQALIRRSGGVAEASTLTAGGLYMDLIRRQVRREEEVIELQPREFALLEYLLRNVGRPVSKTMILESVWDLHFDPQTNVVDVYIRRIRKKLEKQHKKSA